MANKKRKSALRIAGILSFLLVFGTILGACGDGAGGDPDDGGEPLPSANGSNDLSGKSCFVTDDKITFSTTGTGASNGTYSVKGPKYEENDEGSNKPVLDNGKYTYSDRQTGTYSWNEDEKTVTLKVETVSFTQNGPLLDKTAYRQAMQKWVNEYLQNGQEAINGLLTSNGFSSAAEYVEYYTNAAFALMTCRYSFSAGGEALFLQVVLPQNKGVNELEGKTYNGLIWDSEQDKTVKNTNEVFTFTGSKYTFTNTLYNETTTGSYAIDSVGSAGDKWVYLCPETIDGKNQNQYYEMAKQWWPDGDSRYVNNKDYWESTTNRYFQLISWPYHSDNMTIGWGDNGDGGDHPDDGGDPLPPVNGSNALSGKTSFVNFGDKIIFSTTGTGASNGTYTRKIPKGVRHEDGYYEMVLDPNGRYIYDDEQTGTYSWNEAAKTVTLKVESLRFAQSGPLLDKAAHRQKAQNLINEEIQQNGQEAINQMLASQGFSSIEEYIEYYINLVFTLTTYRYSFSADGKALFMQETLPQNKGSNVLSGQTYNGLTWDSEQDKMVKDTHTVYTFTASSYTYTMNTSENTTGSYAIDSVGNNGYKWVYLCPETIDGKNQNQYYEMAKQSWPSGDSRYMNKEDYWAAETNGMFQYREIPYNSANKTIGWED